MGTEVLRPQDCLMAHVRVPPAAVFPRRRTCNPKLRTARSAVQRKKVNNNNQPEAAISKRSSYNDLKTSKNNLVMGQVTILRRGESLDSKMNNKADDPSVSGTERLGPDPETIPKQIRIADQNKFLSDVYAGSAFAVSPSPDSLPLPSFSKKKKPAVSMNVDDSATRDLRRLLGLD